MQRSGDDLGLIAPGWRADIAVFRDLAGFEARLVLASGRSVARDGACLAPTREPETPPFTDTMKLGHLRPEDFQIARTVRWLGSIRSGGKLLALLGLPVCGLLSDHPTAEVAEALSRCGMPRPRWRTGCRPCAASNPWSGLRPPAIRVRISLISTSATEQPERCRGPRLARWARRKPAWGARPDLPWPMTATPRRAILLVKGNLSVRS